VSNLLAVSLGVLGVVGGACLVIQASLNAGLRTQIQSVSWAGFIRRCREARMLAFARPLRLPGSPTSFIHGRARVGALLLGNAYVCAPKTGQILVLADSFPSAK